MRLMKRGRRLMKTGGMLAVMALLLCGSTGSVRAAFLYKSYIVRNAGGRDILCDPYIVQPNDYVLKIFRERGEIAHADFPDFLRIFRHINPHIEDVDRIRPGQHIFIPLKKLSPESLPGQNQGVVTVPFVTISDIDEMLTAEAEQYQVKRGDTISKLLDARFSRYGSTAYAEGVDILKALNPQIDDINRIYAGQEILLPRQSLRNRPWYESLFDAAGKLKQSLQSPAPAPAAMAEAETTAEEEAPGTTAAPEEPALRQIVRLLEGKLFQSGIYYFPRAGKNDFQLDLSAFPVIELPGGRRALISSTDGVGRQLTDGDLSAIRRYWKDTRVIRTASAAPVEELLPAVMNALSEGVSASERHFSEGGVHVTVRPRWLFNQPKSGTALAIHPLSGRKDRTPQPLIAYLAARGLQLKEPVLGRGGDTPPDHAAVAHRQVPEIDLRAAPKPLVRNMMTLLEAPYTQDVPVSFPYGGIQVETVSNLVGRRDGTSVLVDFGDLQGEAVSAIEKAGLEVVRISAEPVPGLLIPRLIRAAGLSCETDPAIAAASGGACTVSLPGFLAKEGETPKVMLSSVVVPEPLIAFFDQAGIKLAYLKSAFSLRAQEAGRE